MRFYLSFIGIGILIVLIDLLFYFIIRSFLRLKSKKNTRILLGVNALITLIFMIGFAYVFSNKPDQSDVSYYQRIFLFLSIFITLYIPKIIILLFGGLEKIIQLPLLLFKKERRTKGRRKFISALGLGIGGITFLGSSYAVGFGKYNFKTHRVKVPIANLPEAFSNYKIIQLSDFHISCYIDQPERLDEILEIIRSLNADILLFTGDMVNNSSDELKPFIQALKGLEMSDGKLAILGNHDYGDYTSWTSEAEKHADHELLIAYEKEAGFDVLLNEHRIIERGKDKLYIVGVENIGKPPFPVYGDLKTALDGIPENSCKILMSHDPSHWTMEILEETDIPLTLSGHTHGMQAGIEIKSLKWSPVQYKYEHWAGLYQHEDQYLYVNRGIGFIGYSGRIGIWPEISLIELVKA